jgi:hypothetical protein
MTQPTLLNVGLTLREEHQSGLSVRKAPDQTRDITCRALQVRADTINQENRSVEAVLATEGRISVLDWRRWEIIDEILIARGAEFADQVVLLETHMRWSLDTLFGSVRELRIDGSRVVGRLFFAEDDEAADRAWKKVRQGHLTDVSVGYRALDYVDIKPNTTQRVNGKAYTAGDRTLRITTSWKIREVSLVPIGADEAAKIREEAGRGAPSEETDTMNEKLRKYLEYLGLRSEADEQEAWAYLGKLTGEDKKRADDLRDGADAPPAEPPAPAQRSEPAAPVTTELRTAPAVAPVDTDAIRREGAEAERRRATGIRKLAGEDVPAELVQRAIDDGWDDNRASREFLQAVREKRAPAVRGDAPAVHAQNIERDCNVRTIGAGLVHRAGLAVIPPTASDERRRELERIAELGDRYRDTSMIDVCRYALQIAGRPIPHGRDETIRAAVSTGELTNIFTTVVNAQVLSSYADTPDTTGPFVRDAEVPDFKSNERIMLGKTAALDKLPRGDTAKHATRGDQKEEYKVARYAKQFVVDEQDIIDDRFNALLDMPNEMGAAARRLRPDLVYAILLANAALGADSVALFHAATHGNLDTSSALAKATLIAAITAMGTQQQDGVNLGLFPQSLLVPHALRFTAKELVRSQQVVATGTTDLLVPAYNALADEGLGVISDSRLDNGVTDPATGTTYTGSATTWFMAARGGRHTIEVGYLRGTGRAPMLRSFVLDKGQWGIGWDIKHDIGAKALDYRGLHKSTA